MDLGKGNWRKKFTVGFLLPKPDCRGRHDKRPWKVPEAIHNKVREQLSFTMQDQVTTLNKKFSTCHLIYPLRGCPSSF